MLFIYSVYLSLLLLKHYWSFTLTLAHCLIYIKPLRSLQGILFYYTSVANTLVNTDVLPQDVCTSILFLAAVATLTASACSSTAFSAKQFCTLFE
jgi:hypothetical protein